MLQQNTFAWKAKAAVFVTRDKSIHKHIKWEYHAKNTYNKTID